MKDLILDIMNILIISGIPLVIGGMFSGLKYLIGANKTAKILNLLRLKSHVAFEAVMFIEDIYKELNGTQKAEMAMDNLISRLNSHGINITQNEAETLISSAYKVAKNDFGIEIEKLSVNAEDTSVSTPSST
jgi:hypothetical protein